MEEVMGVWRTETEEVIGGWRTETERKSGVWGKSVEHGVDGGGRGRGVEN
jgi:hypothetical protein